MDYQKIGLFITEKRKARQLTQEQLATQLSVSPKTISKWENGNGVPETALLKPLCAILDINLNELLSGECLNKDAYKAKAEENLVALLAERRDSQMKIVASVLVAMIGVMAIVFGAVVLDRWVTVWWQQVLVLGYELTVVVLMIIVCAMLDLGTGSYECRHCHRRFVPSAGAYLWGPHVLLKRKLRCPHCGRVSYCQKRLTKEK